jgi:Flp pilus assembly pilin Flp
MERVAYGIGWLMGRLRGERGQDLIEYSLLGGFIAMSLMLALAVAVAALTGSLESMVTGIGNCVDWNASNDCNPF